MSITFLRYFYFSLLILASNSNLVFGQVVPVLNYSTDANGQVLLEVNSTNQHYYTLKVRHDTVGDFELTNSMTIGGEGTTILTEPLASYPLAHYQIVQYEIATPEDVDGDGVDDITEYYSRPNLSPLNAALPVVIEDGSVMIDSLSTFNTLSVKKDEVQWSEFLNGMEYVKYLIADFYTAPKIYFINTNTHDLHGDFASVANVEFLGDNVKKGQIMFHPTSISKNGTLGTYAFNYSNGNPQEFEIVQKTHELLAANMLFLKNNLSYYVTDKSEEQYSEDSILFQNSRVPVLLESDIYAGIDYLALNMAEGFGFFRQMALEEIPGPKDIVLYESLPNSLPRVGGIMTSVIQTPLSHVNLRAIQNNLPNAFIRDPLSVDSVVNLLDHYIYYKVEQDNYFIREASLEEVNQWFEDIRPQNEQIPPLNLSYTSILPLDDIEFTMYDGYGAKCANIATLRTFDFPEGTVPDGFGIPFYFYQEFMNYNNFFDEVDAMIGDAAFQADRLVRNERLDEFRKKIRAAEMPDWMLDELAALHSEFPLGTSVRCRSSSNNEDLPGFNGAGLYDSKTQHPDEGHISKSIKQVYASLWNLRAFEERDFYRINHYISSMGVLCHPNFSEEKANGVGISTDPLYNTQNTFYLNSQIGEELITNPEGNSIPEEILLNRNESNGLDFTVIQRSNLIPEDSAILDEQYLSQMRAYLTIIHNEFGQLYNAAYNNNFAMDIEYKITSDDQLVIKQARPWVSYILEDPSGDGDTRLELNVFPNPANDYIVVRCIDCELSTIKVSNLLGQQFIALNIGNVNINDIYISLHELPPGFYLISGFRMNGELYGAKKFVKIE